uniref:Serine protease 12 n=1 Tax=Costelytra zealandica TaxID=50579 RepID=B0ZBP0_9SCAR|nr:serine protease 12 [Costelytra zealandica]
MKLLAIVVSLFALALCEEDHIDWSKVKTRDIVVTNPITGEFKINSRIVGGQEAVQNQFPYQAGLLVTTPDGIYFCAGALISATTLATAAHCLVSATQVEVRLGAHNVMSQEITQQRFVTLIFANHPGYNPNTLGHDLGVILLPTAATLNAAVQPIPLPSYDDFDRTFAGVPATMVGWGVTADGSTAISQTLRFLSTTIMSNTACNIGYLGQILPSHICTSGEGGVGACTGDSGGAVVAEGRLVGIISFALSFSCQAGWPSGHSRVTASLDWIVAITDAEPSPS